MACAGIAAASMTGLTGLLGLLERAPGGGAIVGLDFDGTRAWPAYDWMGVAKAALEAVNRYLARYLGASGVLLDWDRTADLAKIEVPTLVIGARHDTMDPDYMAMMAEQFPRGSYLYCPNGSHMAIYDDQATWFGGVLDFIREVERGATEG